MRLGILSAASGSFTDRLDSIGQDDNTSHSTIPPLQVDTLWRHIKREAQCKGCQLRSEKQLETLNGNTLPPQARYPFVGKCENTATPKLSPRSRQRRCDCPPRFDR